ncbi:MAG: hypothetical protein ACRDPK_10130 [Carbonactinosporaceae bacterium]
MTTPIVYLHIGAPKTGTTYVQAVLGRNRGRLAGEGVLWPGWDEQVLAVRDVLEDRRAGQRSDQVPGAWSRLCERIHAWRGRAAVVSMEWLVNATPAQVRRVVDTLTPCQVRVVLSARDLARTVVAQWQEAMQSAKTWTWEEFLAGVTADDPGQTAAGRRFWHQQDLGSILRTWGEAVPAERSYLITIPPRGAAGDLLWQRFAAVIGVPADGFDIAVRAGASNQSLGVVSAELMRRLNVVSREQGVSWANYTRYLKHGLAKGQLSRRASLEETLRFPEACYPWAIDRARRLAREIEEFGARVIGDLDELIPIAPGPGTVPPPAEATAADLLEAALFGITGLVATLDSQHHSGTHRTLAAAERHGVAGRLLAAGRRRTVLRRRSGLPQERWAPTSRPATCT